MENLKGLIQQLRAMSAAGTPGEWKAIKPKEGNRLLYIEPAFGADHCHWDGWYIGDKFEDGELVAAMRNNLDTLLDALDSLMAKTKAAEKLAEIAGKAEAVLHAHYFDVTGNEIGEAIEAFRNSNTGEKA